MLRYAKQVRAQCQQQGILTTLFTTIEYCTINFLPPRQKYKKTTDNHDKIRWIKLVLELHCSRIILFKTYAH